MSSRDRHITENHRTLSDLKATNDHLYNKLETLHNKVTHITHLNDTITQLPFKTKGMDILFLRSKSELDAKAFETNQHVHRRNNRGHQTLI